MRIKSILLLLVCFLLFGLTMPAIACPPPDCGSCCHWVSTGPGPSDGYCELDAECGDCRGCYNPCYSCVSCYCERDCSPTQSCCTDSGDYCCESDESCCQGNCCEGCESCVDGNCEDDDDNCDPDECCIDGNCIDPKCEDCDPVSDAIIECGHFSHSLEGSPCATTWCIIVELESATCDYKGLLWPCSKARCNTTLSMDPEAILYSISQACPGGTLHWVFWYQFWYGCTDCMTEGPRAKACETDVCSGVPISTEYRGFKKICGGCG